MFYYLSAGFETPYIPFQGCFIYNVSCFQQAWTRCGGGQTTKHGIINEILKTIIQLLLYIITNYITIVCIYLLH